GHDFEGVLPLYTAARIDQARAAFRLYDTISGNFCFADTHGDIGYQYTGRIPKRPAWPLPVPGWDGAHEWDGDVPKEALPTAANPPTDYIANANTRTTTPDYPHFLSFATAVWRANRLQEIFAARETFSLEDMPAMHGDLLSTLARELAARHLAAPATDPDARAMQALLRGWDYVVDLESTAAVVYMETTAQLLEMTVL